MIAKASGPDARAFGVPIHDVKVEDVWQTSGMFGTSSNDIITKKFFLPKHRSVSTAQLFNGTDAIHDNPLQADSSLKCNGLMTRV